MKGIQTTIVTRLEDMPAVSERDFFHSRQLFAICSQTPRMRPYMVVCTSSDDGAVLSQLLVALRYRTTLLPPFILTHCHVVGEGDYAERCAAQRELLFGEMLAAVTRHLSNKALYIEFSNLSQKMFGYRHFRQQRYFPVHWMSIHNSLHSRLPEERITPRMKKRVDNAYARGVECHTVETEDDLKAFNKLLRRHHWLKPKRYIPDSRFFVTLRQSNRCQLFVTKYRNHVIGCSACAYSDTDAYLWYSAFRRKTYLPLHPDAVTVWHAIKYAHAQGYQHIRFLDVGLPFQKNPFRDFILSFGGKPVSTYRWFHCSIGWLNALFSWIYRD